jgi:hypothetical protein
VAAADVTAADVTAEVAAAAVLSVSWAMHPVGLS